MDKSFLEDFNKLAGVEKVEITEDSVKALHTSFRNILESTGVKRGWIQKDLAEIAIAAASNAKLGKLIYTNEGIEILSKVVGEIISEMVATSVRKFAK